MTSIKVKFRTSGTTDKEGTIYYQLTHNRQVRQIVSNYRISSDDWTGSRFPLKEDVNADIERIGRIIRLLDEKGDYTADDVVDEYRKYQFAGSLFNYIESLIDTLRKRNKIRTAETYHATLNSLKRYFNGKDIMIDRISSDTVEAYEVFLQNRGLTPNTTSFYMRIFRAVYNRAVSESKMERRNPFKYVYTGIEKTIKRALPVNVMRKIKNLDLSDMPSADFARDMFMLSFYLRGMSFVDMAFLRKSDLSYGYVTYRRRKTGQSLTVKWTKEMQNILDKYPTNATQYLFPIITNSGINELNAYRRCGYNINRNLKTVAKKAGMNAPLTLYCARHSWASIAHSKGVAVSVISEGMGHDSESTTRIYLASLDTSTIDKANSLIIASIG